LIAIAGGPAAYAVNTAATPHTGSTPSAGPAVSNAGGMGGPGGMRGFGGGSAPAFRSGAAPNGMPSFGTPPSGAKQPSGAQQPSGTRPSGGSGGGTGGFGGGATASSALVTLLKNAGTTWSAATIGSQSAAPLQLQSGTAVMAIGGFSGSDNSPTLAQFEKLVAAGKIRYFIGGGQGGGPGGGGGGSGSQIANWVAAHYTATTVGGSTVYDLTKAAS
jgi:hypothetical protein